MSKNLFRNLTTIKVSILKSLIVILFFSNKPIYSQLYSLSVNLNGYPSAQMIRSYQTKTIFIVLDDLLDVVGVQYKFDINTLREEILIGDSKLYVVAFNPFLYLIKNNGMSLSYQMLQSTDYKYGKIFIPLKSFIEFLNRYTNMKVDFNEKSFLLLIKTEKSLTTLDVKSKTENPLEPLKSITEPEKSLKSNQTSNLSISESKKDYDLYDFLIEEKSNGYIFRIKSRKPIQSISKNLSGNYLYLRIPNSSINLEKFNATINNGLIESVSAIQNDKNSDLKIKLKEKIQSHEIVREKRTNDILLLLHVSSEIIKKIKDEKRSKSLSKNNLLDVIVIDAGHGGRDPGAIGYKGTKEKDVNLAIALKLGNLIQKNLKDVKVVYTRKNDEFIELYRRGQIANENKGKLFISIHCNSTDERPGTRRGSEVYILRPGRTEDAIRIAERENSVIKLEEGYQERYKHLTDENFILTAMVSTANVKHSEKFAEILSKKIEEGVAINHNGVKQAGFYVLVGASMPGVLIETGYINHPEDEALLRSEKGQQKFAETIFRAILDYKNYYDNLATKQ